MNNLFWLLIISFLLLLIGYMSLRKGIENDSFVKDSQAIKVGMSAIRWGIAIQLFILIALLYLYYEW